MIAFASNSLLCRLALKHTTIDPASFTFIRILSGAAALLLITTTRRLSIGNRTASSLLKESSHSSLVNEHPSPRQPGDWPSALALFAYAAAFSFAYNTLSAGTGALLLFGAVQATMILWGLRDGERLHAPTTCWSRPGFNRICRPLAPRSFGSTFAWCDPDAGSGSGLGHLFAARESRR